MLIGEHWHTIDPKNRIMVPARLRTELGNSFMLTRGLDNCIYAYPMEEWLKFEEKLAALPDTRSDARKFKRFFLSGAVEVEMDKQGRVLIPANLVEYGNLNNDVVTIGMQSKLEIWSKENWTRYQEQEINMDEVAESMADLGI
ncbi:MAG: division/cell wall cluster transcriptional repressor MraZ [Clostridiaceae bacterium]